MKYPEKVIHRPDKIPDVRYPDKVERRPDKKNSSPAGMSYVVRRYPKYSILIPQEDKWRRSPIRINFIRIPEEDTRRHAIQHS